MLYRVEIKSVVSHQVASGGVEATLTDENNVNAEIAEKKNAEMEVVVATVVEVAVDDVMIEIAEGMTEIMIKKMRGIKERQTEIITEKLK